MSMPNRSWGVEIEVAGLTKLQVLTALRMHGITVRDPDQPLNHNITLGMWRMHNDTSIHDTVAEQAGRPTRACEAVSPIFFGPEGLDQITKVCTALKSAGGYVNDSCGIHVHVGADDLTLQEVITLVKRYAKWETELDLLFPVGRRGSLNRYCLSPNELLPIINDGQHANDIRSIKENIQCLEHELERLTNEPLAFCQRCLRWATREGVRHDTAKVLERSKKCVTCDDLKRNTTQRLNSFKNELKTYESYPKEWENLEQLSYSLSRYNKVNVNAFQKHRTIEFRQHHGSLDPVEIRNWVLFVLNFVEESRALTPGRAVSPAVLFDLTLTPGDRAKRAKALFKLIASSGPKGIRLLEAAEILGMTRRQLDTAYSDIRNELAEFNRSNPSLKGTLHSVLPADQDGVSAVKFMFGPSTRPIEKDKDTSPFQGLSRRMQRLFKEKVKMEQVVTSAQPASVQSSPVQEDEELAFLRDLEEGRSAQQATSSTPPVDIETSFRAVRFIPTTTITLATENNGLAEASSAVTINSVEQTVAEPIAALAEPVVDSPSTPPSVEETTSQPHSRLSNEEARALTQELRQVAAEFYSGGAWDDSNYLDFLLNGRALSIARSRRRGR